MRVRETVLKSVRQELCPANLFVCVMGKMGRRNFNAPATSEMDYEPACARLLTAAAATLFTLSVPNNQPNKQTTFNFFRTEIPIATVCFRRTPTVGERLL